MNLVVEQVPPMSCVWKPPSFSVLKSADSNLSANEGNWRCDNIIAVDRSMAVGLAKSFPASSLATWRAP